MNGCACSSGTMQVGNIVFKLRTCLWVISFFTTFWLTPFKSPILFSLPFSGIARAHFCPYFSPLHPAICIPFRLYVYYFIRFLHWFVCVYAVVEVNRLPINCCFCSLQLLTFISISSAAITRAGWWTMFSRRRRSPASSGSYNRLQIWAVQGRGKNKDWYIRYSWDSSSVRGTHIYANLELLPVVTHMCQGTVHSLSQVIAE